MNREFSYGLRVTFLLHAIVAGISGLCFLLVPQVWGSISNWELAEPVLYRLLGGALLGFAASSWFAYKGKTWEQVKIIVQTEIVWTVLAGIVIFFGLLAGAFPALGWVNFIIFALFAIAFINFYQKESKNLDANENISG